VEGQKAPQDESSSESCLHCEVNEPVQEHIEGQEKVGIADLAVNLEEAGTWYYVVDCATCKAVIPFKHAPEDEPILRFPTMRVRCFQCHTDHTYAADLVSHRKAAVPRGIFKRDRPPSYECDGNQEASRDRQEDRGRDLGRRVILECEIDPVSSSLRRDDIVIAAVSGKRATIFFLSSCFFAAGWVLQLALYIVYNELPSSGPAVLLVTACSGTVLLGLALFIFGAGSFFVEVCGFKPNIDQFVLKNLLLKISSLKMLIAEHTENWAKVIRAANIKAERHGRRPRYSVKSDTGTTARPFRHR
jgi:hypothetical protein